MDSVGWFYFLFIAGVIALLVYLNKQAASDSGSYTPPSPAPAPKPPATKPSAPAPVKKEEQKYVSIYEYTAVQPVRKCAHCDGENAYGAKVCRICGNDIDS